MINEGWESFSSSNSEPDYDLELEPATDISIYWLLWLLTWDF